MNERKLLIVGAGSLGIMALDIALSNRTYKEENIYFIDDFKKKGHSILGFKVIGGVDYLSFLNAEDFDVVIAIADNSVRKNIVTNRKLNFVNLIHRDSTISDFAKIGIGNIILPNVSIDPLAIIENHVVINKNCSIGHNVTMKNFSQACPGCKLAGEIGEEVFLGLGSIVLPGRKVGSKSIIGAGAVVNKDIPTGVTAVGIPAKVIK